MSKEYIFKINGALYNEETGEAVMKPEFKGELIRCKDCKYWHREIHNGIEYFTFSSCDLNHCGDGRDFYCADAKRKEEEAE